MTGKGPQEAPYNARGNLLHYPLDVPYGQEAEWRPIEPFTAALTYDGYGRGRSAVYFHWKHLDTGARYPMFLTDMDALLNAGLVQGHLVTGRFTVVKRGKNYGLTYLGPAEGHDS